jgi:hypothetical protein
MRWRKTSTWIKEELISNKCGKCNGTVECHSEGEPSTTFWWDTCIECGDFQWNDLIDDDSGISGDYGTLSLKEINDKREKQDLPLLTELKRRNWKYRYLGWVADTD